MADMLVVPGRAAGLRYVNIEDQADVWTFVEPVPSPAPIGTPYRRLGALGDTTTPGPYLYTVELDIAPENLAAVFEWYEHEHLPMLTSCPGCLGGVRYQRLDDGAPNLLAAYRFVSPEVNQTPEWDRARSTEWTLRMRPFFRGSRRFVRKLEA